MAKPDCHLVNLVRKEEDGQNAPATKADFVRQKIETHSAEGITAGELYDAFRERAIPIQRAYIYSLLKRLQEQKDIREHKGRYYPFAGWKASTS